MIRGVIEDGQIVSLDPVRWPNGTAVRIMAFETTADEAVQADDPRAVDDWIAWLHSLEPFEMTAEETSRWQADRERRKADEMASFAADVDRLRRVWE